MSSYYFVLLHGYKGTSQSIFLPWLKNQLEQKGHTVSVPDLPNSATPSEKEQVDAVLQHETLNTQTVLFGHSLGAVIAMKVVEKLENPVRALILAGGFADVKFKDRERPFTNTFDWNFDFEKIKKNAETIKILHDIHDYAIPHEQAELLQQKLSAELFTVAAQKPHFMDAQEPTILQHILP